MNITYKKYIRLLIIILAYSLPSISFAAISNSEFVKRINELPKNPVTNLPVPIVFGVDVGDVTDTWGEARSNGRTHEGTDIFAPRGMLIASPTKAVVHRIGTSGRGGLHVWTINPGGERFYYAHLNGIYPGLEVGDKLEVGDPIGFVGDSGNAKGGQTHLHWGIYSNDWKATNPFPRITRNLNEEEQEVALRAFLEYLIDLIEELKKTAQ